MIPLISKRDLNQAQRLSGWRPEGNLAKIILVEIAATKRATDIIYGAMAIPLTATWSVSVFERLKGSASKSAFFGSVEALFNCLSASVNP